MSDDNIYFIKRALYEAVLNNDNNTIKTIFI